MKTPKLKKIESVKKHHGISLEDHYAWVDQPNILEVLKDPNKLLPEVRNYIEENNSKKQKHKKAPIDCTTSLLSSNFSSKNSGANTNTFFGH